MFDKTHHIHCLGIGGSGLSALASWFLAQGKAVTGSDVADSAFTKILRQEGATVFIGHDDDHLSKTVDLVIYSEAIDKAKNPEYLAAVKRGLKILSYFEALGELSKTKKTLVVTGTHGKTTTTALLGVALIKAGFDPTVIVGSRVPEFNNRNLYIGKSDWFVVEGCEYRRSFLNLQPQGILVLNCEPDHLDYYKGEADYVSAFAELVKKLPRDGFLITNVQDKNAIKVAEGFTGKKIQIDQKTVDDFGWNLKLWGDHNRWNVTFALKAAEVLGVNLTGVRTALEEFRGTARRSEIRGKVNGAIIIDDYGHHPTEVCVTLKAIREQFLKQRIICVFQPHQYSRTQVFLKDFVHAFADADQVIIPGIYEARDTAEDKQKINAQQLVERIATAHPQVRWGETLAKTEILIRQEAKEGDVIVIMGAGDVGNLVENLLAKK